MTIDLEADLRHEFDAASMPSSLNFRPETVLREGNRTIRRRRIASAGSAAMAITLVAGGAALLTRPHDLAAPQPATRTATSGIVRGEMGVSTGTFQVEVNRDTKVTSNVKFFFTTDKGRHEVGVASIGQPGQKPDASWKSGMADGHPFTVGLVPGTGTDIKLAGGASHGISSDELKGTGYTMFAVEYKNGDEKEAARPATIASISWSGPTGVVDGIAGDDRLTGQILALEGFVTVKVMLRPGDGGRTTVIGSTTLQNGSGSSGADLSVATTDASGVAVVTGHRLIGRKVPLKGVLATEVSDGAPLAAGILPAGASNIGVVLTTEEAATGHAVSEHLPDGRVIFAVEADFGRSAGASERDVSKDSIKAITWTNADGTSGRKDVRQFHR